jgi:benzoyl-CoA reductase subunit C
MDIIDKYYLNYGVRARELKAQGHKIMGYLCALVPLEIISAAGFIPFRIKGDVNEPITKADTQMETIVCPLVRSCFDIAVKGRYDFLDGIVIPHACDSICRTYDIWKYNLSLPYSHFINMPHGTDDSSLEFYKAVLGTLKKSLERYTGNEISHQGLAKSIKEYNNYRGIVRDLMGLRKHSPPLISGEEYTKTLIAGMSLPLDEATNFIESVIKEATARGNNKETKPRLLIVGAQIDDASIINLIEDCGAYVVADDLCPGSREYLTDVELNGDPVAAIAKRYLREVHCGRTYQEQKGSYIEYLEDRYGHIGKMIKEFDVDGVVFYIYKYCDPFGFEVPSMKKYIESINTKVLYLEDEYSFVSTARLRTRIQAFLEIVDSGL